MHHLYKVDYLNEVRKTITETILASQGHPREVNFPAAFITNTNAENRAEYGPMLYKEDNYRKGAKCYIKGDPFELTTDSITQNNVFLVTPADLAAGNISFGVELFEGSDTGNSEVVGRSTVTLYMINDATKPLGDKISTFGEKLIPCRNKFHSVRVKDCGK